MVPRSENIGVFLTLGLKRQEDKDRDPQTEPLRGEGRLTGARGHQVLAAPQGGGQGPKHLPSAPFLPPVSFLRPHGPEPPGSPPAWEPVRAALGHRAGCERWRDHLEGKSGCPAHLPRPRKAWLHTFGPPWQAGQGQGVALQEVLSCHFWFSSNWCDLGKSRPP